MDEMKSWQLKKGRIITPKTTMNPAPSKTHSDSFTVYEEIMGDDAIMEVLNIFKNVEDLYHLGGKSGSYGHIGRRNDKEQGEKNVAKNNNSVEKLQEIDGYTSPNIPEPLHAFGIKPFARIETTRFKWKLKSSSALLAELTASLKNVADISFLSDITVDIDVTDFGYTVGEVEAVVPSVDQVDAAKEVVQRIVSRMNDCTSSSSNSNMNKDVASVLGKLETFLIQKRPDVYSACVKAGVMKGTRE
jgi:hypothetical protein